jgi:hypothetical protein
MSRNIGGNRVMNLRNQFIAGVAVLAASGSSVPSARASSHREAPLISQDPCADNNDTYAWVDAGTHTNLNLAATYIPLEEPAGGPNFHSLCDDVLYAISIVRGTSSLDPVLTYYIQTHTTKPPYVDVADLNAAVGGGKEFFSQISGSVQTFTVWKEVNGIRTKIVDGAPVAPPNIGPRTFAVAGYAMKPATPSAETAYTDAYAAAFVTPMGTGGAEGSAFVGPRDDPFFVDLGGVFDLANLRPAGTAQDNVAGYNGHAIVLSVPTSIVTSDGMPAGTTPSDTRTYIGVYAQSFRRKATILRNDGYKEGIGPWVRVSRLGLPLINEAVIGLQSKDYWNRSSPKDDVPVFGAYFLNPIIVRDAQAVGQYSACAMGAPTSTCQAPGVDPTPFKSGRTDILDTVNLKDSPTMGLHNTPLTATGDVLRLDMATDSAFPNGRRLADDVTDTILSLFLAKLMLPITDNVGHNDKPYLTAMPFLAGPWEGYSQGHGKVPM